MKEYIAGLLLLKALSGQPDLPEKYINNCHSGDSLKYNKLEILAEAKEGQTLFKIDGKFYGGAKDSFLYGFENPKGEHCLMFDFRDLLVNYTEKNGNKIFSTMSKKGDVAEYIWAKDGSFLQVHHSK